MRVLQSMAENAERAGKMVAQVYTRDLLSFPPVSGITAIKAFWWGGRERR